MTQSDDSFQRENARLRGDLHTVARRICHDLRMPLGGIIATTEALKEELAAKNPAGAALGEAILNSTDDLARLIDRVSFVLRASINPIPKKAAAMEEIVLAALEQLERKIRKTGASISQPESWPFVPGVASWLQTIWWNLIANGLEHAGKSPRIELGWREEFGECRFWVRDNGAGVSAKKRDKLFQPFHLLHEPNSPHGLGLPIVQRLVELQGGHCGYEPDSGGGAFFYFTLPSAENEHET
ncbi:MAG: sensor histidine kinase [Limisphaerales bacterium]